MGVMGETVTAMRDPIFYRWHKMIDSLFQQFKSNLQPYTKEQVISIHLVLPVVQSYSDVQWPINSRVYF